MGSASKASNFLKFVIILPLLIVAIPLAGLAALVTWIFGLKRNLSARDVADELRDFLESRGGASAWDDFTTLAIADPKLDHIRERAFEVALPLTDEGRATLQELLAEAERMASEQGDG
jgi:hypothetical protein